MNIRKYLIVLTALMLALLPAACGAQEEPSGDLPELVIGSDDYRPYNYLDENGQAAGVDVALATEACRRMGYEPVFRQISWDEKDLLLESGQVDCLWGCFSMNGRENTYLWAGPYLYSDQLVAVRADSDIYTLADLADRRVAVQVSSKAESILSDPTDARIPQLRALYCLVDMDQVATALRKYYVDACASHAEALAGALEKSCNGYFIRLGQALGADAVRAMAEQLGFGQAIPLTDALHTAAGVLPEREALASSGAYANFCFGQGELLASPLQVAAMMNTIACGGICRTPLLLETTLDETTGTPLAALSHVRSRRVLTKRTAAALQALLAGVVAGGTGHEAALPGQTAAGKTGTAQTGQFSGGTELKNYWFAGFVPAEHPRYTIVVLQDTQAEPAFSSAAIFARVAAGLEILAP